MNRLIFVCLAVVLAYVCSEKCMSVSDCVQTLCHEDHGWWMHCMDHMCLCTHDSFVGQNCTDGDPHTCQALHGDRCANNNMHWRCVDNICHCTRL